MYCFEHEGINAVGICVKCHKGVCRNCMIDQGVGLSCRSHSKDVNDIDSVFKKNAAANQLAAKKWYVLPTFIILIGFIFTIEELISWYKNEANLFNPLTLMGSLFIAFGFIILFINYKFFKTKLKSRAE